MAKRSAPYQHQWVQFDGEMSMEAEIILNLALIGQGSGQFAPSCYQISEAMAQALNEKGIEAESVCADFYCINPSGLRLQKDAKMYLKVHKYILLLKNHHHLNHHSKHLPN